MLSFSTIFPIRDSLSFLLKNFGASNNVLTYVQQFFINTDSILSLNVHWIAKLILTDSNNIQEEGIPKQLVLLTLPLSGRLFSGHLVYRIYTELESREFNSTPSAS